MDAPFTAAEDDVFTFDVHVIADWNVLFYVCMLGDPGSIRNCWVEADSLRESSPLNEYLAPDNRLLIERLTGV